MSITKLEAVNTMIGCLGEAPVSDLEATSNADVVTAVATLDEVSKTVQLRGWYWNTVQSLTLSLDIDSKIPVPPNTLSITPRDESISLEVGIRNNFLFNLEDNTYVFDAAVKATVVQFLEWEELPSVLQSYIQVKAARILVQRVLGDGTEARFTSADENEALIEARRQNRNKLKLNAGKGSMYNLSIGWRRPR